MDWPEKEQEETSQKSTENAAMSEEHKHEKNLKPIWEKFMQGVKSRQKQKKITVWDSMIKKLNRIRAFQKSNQKTEISEMFDAEPDDDKQKTEECKAAGAGEL